MVKISLEWLRDFVDYGSDNEVIDALTDVGLNVDEVIKPHVDGKVVVGKVEDVYRHPNAERLNICRVNIGDRYLNLITADKTVKVGDYVPVALPGTKLANGKVVETVEMRGVSSEGMMCSLEELGVEQESKEVYKFEFEVTEGQDVVKLLKLDDTVLDVEITPNRGDALSYLGVARDVAARMKRNLRVPNPEIEEGNGRTEEIVSVEIKDSEGCPRYSVMVVEGVKVKESPVWLKRRLMASGIRPINNVVDATNYVMLELGHPIHAFDLNLVKSRRIVVRSAKEGESVVLLDGKEYILNGGETLITDGGEEIIAVGGVMGAENSGINDNTSSVLIEVAYFDPVKIRRTAKGLGLSTDASYRFERGVDPEDNELVMKRVVELITSLAGGRPSKGMVDVKLRDFKTDLIDLRTNRVKEILGIEIPEWEIEDILKRLGFKLSRTYYGWKVEVPSFRIHDVYREIDLIEEIGRIYGYGKIEEERTYVWSGLGGLNDYQKFRRRVGEITRALGFDEVVTFSFTSSKIVEKWNFKDVEILRPLNPITDDLDVMRSSLVYTLVQALSYNYTHQVRNVKFYEMGKVFWKEGENAKESEVLGAIATGLENEMDYTDKREISFYTFKGYVDELFSRLGVEASYERAELEGFVPTRTARMSSRGKVLGFLGMLDPEVVERFDIKSDVYYFEIYLQELYEASEKIPRYRPSPVFPSVKRDVAFLMGKGVESSKVIEDIRSLGEGLVEDVRIIDVYSGKGVPEDMVSITFSITFRSSERTLKDEEVSELFEKIVSEIEKKHGLRRRF